VSPRLAAENPRAISALSELSGRIDEQHMREWNRRVEVDGVPVAAVARDALDSLGLRTHAAATQPAAESTSRGGLVQYLVDQRATLLRLTGRHVELVAVSLLAAILIALPLGLALERTSRRAEGVIRAVGVLQTLPGIALLAFMIPLLGIGVVPALVALVLYSLYPIVRNTYTGVRDADSAAVAAARALGMTDGQILREVRLPLAAPVIMAGIRTAAVIDVGTATLAAFIGAGGLGEPIVAGLALSDTRMILAGAIPAALLAIGVDALLAVVERATRLEGRGKREGGRGGKGVGGAGGAGHGAAVALFRRPPNRNPHPPSSPFPLPSSLSRTFREQTRPEFLPFSRDRRALAGSSAVDRAGASIGARETHRFARALAATAVPR
jgi:osmoprotectant transport system permease protein